MIASIILILILVAVGLPLWLIDRRKHHDDEEDTIVEPQESCTDDCCSTHEVCPSQELLADLDKAAVYYDDEHLDQYAGREANQYSDSEIEEFRDVLYTLIPTDRMGWCKSLKKRGIVMPAPIHDEFIMLVNE